jgi:hypothetical protein
MAGAAEAVKKILRRRGETAAEQEDSSRRDREPRRRPAAGAGAPGGRTRGSRVAGIGPAARARGGCQDRGDVVTEVNPLSVKIKLVKDAGTSG